jgi:hypothetical protein
MGIKEAKEKKGELPVLGAAAWTCCGMWYVASCGTIST